MPTTPKPKALTLTRELAAAYIRGQKRRTRRPFSPLPKAHTVELIDPYTVSDGATIFEPPSYPDDVLWLREPAIVDAIRADPCLFVRLRYPADGGLSEWIEYPHRLTWTPKINHGCPNGVFREGARHYALVENVWFHRLCDTTPTDAWLEGAPSVPYDPTADETDLNNALLNSFFTLWDNLYAHYSPFQSPANPWVWARALSPLPNYANANHDRPQKGKPSPCQSDPEHFRS